MPLTLALTEAHIEKIGSDNLQKLIEGYEEAFPDLNLIADVVLVDTAEIHRLNKEQRNIDEPTDVLSFPTLPDFQSIMAQAKTQPALIGTIIINPEKVEEYEETLIQMVHHGLIHLLGYDHDTDFPAWMSEEKRILKIFEKHSLFIPPVPYESV